MDIGILVGLNLKEAIDIDYQLQELQELAETCFIDIKYKLVQTKTIDPKYYIGKGKLEELKEAINNFDANIVIFNDELEPFQLRNLENYLQIKVIDRSLLILNIFAKRAKSYQSSLEVELAQLKYMLPRLKGLSSSLSRQGSGFNAKGPGEKQIELDRRKIEKQIVKLNQKLSEIKISRLGRKNKRANNEIKIVALVGYTNAGKSSLMNRLVKEFGYKKDKTVYEQDELFATLETSSRHIILNDNTEFLLIDTVGFISKLPHHLVNSFKSTLEEAIDADYILQVVDVSNQYYNEQINICNNVLSSLNITAPKLYVFNKADLLEEQFFLEYDNSILISTKTDQNIYTLLNIIKENIKVDSTILILEIPYSRYDLVNKIYTEEKMISIKNLDSHVFIEAKVKNKNIHHYINYKKNF